MKHRRLGALVALTLVVGGAAFVGCSGSDDASSAKTPAPAQKWTDGYPSSIAVLGHSGATGENSDPDEPGVEVRANSWATGSNPDVNSVYRRILERNPRIKGHNDNYAEAGADVNALAGQADRLLAGRRKPDLILIQIMDNDMTCPVDRPALADFRRRLTAIVKKLAREAPDSREFVITQFGSVDTYARTLTRDERAAQGGTDPCAFMSPSGDVPPKKVAHAEKAIHAYETALKTACETVRQCTLDGGAVGSIVDRRRYYSSDHNHLNVEGHAKVAATVWAAMRRADVVPKR